MKIQHCNVYIFSSRIVFVKKQAIQFLNFFNDNIMQSKGFVFEFNSFLKLQNCSFSKFLTKEELTLGRRIGVSSKRIFLKLFVMVRLSHFILPSFSDFSFFNLSIRHPSHRLYIITLPMLPHVRKVRYDEHTRQFPGSGDQNAAHCAGLMNERELRKRRW